MPDPIYLPHTGAKFRFFMDSEKGDPSHEMKHREKNSLRLAP